MRPGDVDLILGRPQRPLPTREPLAKLAAERIIVTGARGSIGEAIVPILHAAGVKTWATDIGSLDVRSDYAAAAAVVAFEPTLILHLAGAKHAPEGEHDPYGACLTNTIGTANVIATGVRVVLASTCKAADPETSYGASKLIAERMTLNAGGAVARFYNVPETCGNVFGLWSAIPADEPLPVMDCYRYFISLAEAVSLTLWSMIVGPGRFTIDPGARRWIPDVAAALYPGRQLEVVPARRGDRRAEPRTAMHEALTALSPHALERITSPHDPIETTMAVAA